MNLFVYLMAQGIKERWNSDWVLAITGVAGSGKMQKDPPVGTVFIGVLGPNCQKVEQILLDKKIVRIYGINLLFLHWIFCIPV